MISIVIPLYNKAKSIANTIKCIQNQTYQDFEIVVVEGWSTDGSTEIIKKNATEEPRLRVLMQVNRKGVTPARNESIEAAKYDRIAFIDADDYWEPTYLETLVKLMDDFPQAGIWGMNHGFITQNGKQKNTELIHAIYYKNFRGIIYNPWQYGSPYWTGAVGISKTAFEKVGGFDNRIIFGEDIDLWYRLMLEFPCAYEDKTLSYYRVDAENRACNNTFPLNIHLPYYIDKYAKHRKDNVDFRKYFDLQCLYRLFPYALENTHNPELKRVLSQIDFSQQKFSMRLRFLCPRLYDFYTKIK
ncbi:MAG: glycosyltransferase [Bacteroidia bacterium]|nr:glycosyltransferase [Bacteroidia bacterium]